MVKDFVYEEKVSSLAGSNSMETWKQSKLKQVIFQCLVYLLLLSND